MSLLKTSLKKDSPLPLYYQLKEIILNEITEGKLIVGDALPTENEWMNAYKISRATVRQAMSELVNEGYLSRQKGKGTFVSKPKMTQKYINRIETYEEQMRKIGKSISTQVIGCKVIKSSIAICKALGLSSGDKAIHLVRLRRVDEEPIGLAETYLPYKICGFILERDMVHESLYKVLSEKEQTRIVKAKRTIEAVLASEEDAKLLGIQKGEALQVVRTMASNNEDEIMEYTVAKYRGDRNLFAVETQVDL